MCAFLTTFRLRETTRSCSATAFSGATVSFTSSDTAFMFFTSYSRESTDASVRHAVAKSLSV